MVDKDLMTMFVEAAQKVGAAPVQAKGLGEAVSYIARNAGGAILLPSFPSGGKADLCGSLRQAGCEVLEDDFRLNGRQAAAGVTGANFALADTGTVVLESTAEAVRLATTLPERHFVLLDPRKILPDGLAAARILRQLHQRDPRLFLAYITGPSRTADIERVLTIGVHGPKELHILLLEGISDDPLEM
jgi:L-lactate dehydrogenase complex protein LldG